MHEHNHIHKLKYCEKCDVVYCEDCKREWGKTHWWTYRQTYPYYEPFATYQPPKVYYGTSDDLRWTTSWGTTGENATGTTDAICSH